MRIYGLGAGIFIIACMWFGLFVAQIFINRLKGNITIISAIVATVITLVFAILPQEDSLVDDKAHTYVELIDHMLLWRILILAVIIASAVGGVLGVVYLSWKKPRYPRVLHRLYKVPKYV